MPAGFTRRRFIRAGLVLGAALGLGLPRLARMQGPSPTSTPEDDTSMSLPLTGFTRTAHDPVIIKSDGVYWVYCTGAGIPARRSLDRLDWKLFLPAIPFTGVITEAQRAIPGSEGSIWAPDISYYNGKYQLYFSASTFGSNRSAIGLATNETLKVTDDAFRWVDEGIVIESHLTDDYNCIDPNFVLDEEGAPWLVFGSFWSGIKMRRLDPETRKLSTEDETLYSLARRFEDNGAVEAPFIVRKGDYYYLFVSFGACCRGAASDYLVMVGRSEAITGPYVDRDGVPMLRGGGTQVTFPTERWRGPGHNGILLDDDGVDYIVYHAYDAADRLENSYLHINTLVWDDDGWPLPVYPGGAE